MKTMTKMIFAATVAISGISASTVAQAGVVFGATSYNQSLTLSSGNSYNTSTGATFANGNYLTVQGGTGSAPISQYSTAGTLIAGPSAPSAGIDFRSISATSTGAVYAYGYTYSNTVYRQSGAFNNFVAAVALSGSMNSQAQVVVSADGSKFYGNDGGILRVWDSSSGTLLRSVTLGSGTSQYGLAAYGNYVLNANGGVLRAFDVTTGAVVDQAILTGSVSGYANIYGQGYGNGYFFLAANDGTEVGYAIGAPAAIGGAVPEPATWGMMIAGFGMMGAVLRTRRRSTKVMFA